MRPRSRKKDADGGKRRSNNRRRRMKFTKAVIFSLGSDERTNQPTFGFVIARVFSALPNSDVSNRHWSASTSAGSATRDCDVRVGGGERSEFFRFKKFERIRAIRVFGKDLTSKRLPRGFFAPIRTSALPPYTAHGRDTLFIGQQSACTPSSVRRF